jgi:hypothetical protein
MAPVARRAHAAVADDTLWRRLYERRYGPPAHHHFIEHGKDWRWLYRARSQRGTFGSTGPGCVAAGSKNEYFYCGDLRRCGPHGYGLRVRVEARDVAQCADARDAFRLSPRSRIEGQWKDGLACGRVIQILDNGDHYQGEYASGVRHGHGVLRYSSGHCYTGQWQREAWDGDGTLTLPNGQSHRGRWRSGAPHGWGVHTWPNGQRVEGTWDGAGHPCGQAVLIAADGRRFFDDAAEVFCIGGVTVPDGADLGGRIKCMRSGPTGDPAHPMAFDALYLDGSCLFCRMPYGRSRSHLPRSCSFVPLRARRRSR